MSTATPTRPTADRAPRPAGLSTPRAAWLVAERELRTRLRTKSFLISTGILLLVVLASIVIGGVLSANTEPTKVAVVGSPEVGGQSISSIEGLKVTAADDQAAAEKLVRDGDVDAAIVPDSSTPLGFAIIAESSAPSEVVQLLSVAPPVQLLDPDAVNPGIRYLIALGFGIVFFMAAMTFGTTIAQSVVEEKSTRVIEILLATISARALLAGKVIGNSILAFGQIALLLAVIVIGLTVTGQSELLVGLGTPIIWFAIFFVVGFVLLAALFAATGAMVSRQEDIASTTTPVTMLVMAPYFLIIFLNDNETVVTIMSYVPFSAPVGMPLRLFLGDAQWWEPLLSLVILIVSTLLVLALGARIYENSLLKLGARVPWREALKR